MARFDLTVIMAACLTLLLLSLGGSVVGADARAINGDEKGNILRATNVTVNFTLDYQVTYGDGFVIAGNITELGDWSTYDAPLMNIISGVSVWSVAVTLTQGTAFEFKPVLVDYDTKAPIQWYSGNNIVYVANSDSLIVLCWPGNSLVKEVV